MGVVGGDTQRRQGEGEKDFLDQVPLHDMNTNSKEGRVGDGCARGAKSYWSNQECHGCELSVPFHIFFIFILFSTSYLCGFIIN